MWNCRERTKETCLSEITMELSYITETITQPRFHIKTAIQLKKLVHSMERRFKAANSAKIY